MVKVLLVGTVDSKFEELNYIRNSLRRNGVTPILVDVSTGPQHDIPCDIPRSQIISSLAESKKILFGRKENRSQCIEAMCQAVGPYINNYCKSNSVQGIMAIGGGGGTAIGTASMKNLPIGFPKVMLTTMAAGNTAQYIEGTDINLFPSVVDVAGLNEISKLIFDQASAAISGMARHYSPSPSSPSRPIIAATMFGNTTPCVNEARAYLEENGYDVLVFHANGNGGRTMEKLILSGKIAGVLDITTTEIADEVAGGVLSAGPLRLEAAAKMNIPTVIAPGCVDMINFHGRHSIPTGYSERKLYQHTPEVTLIRTNGKEMKKIGDFLSKKFSQYSSNAVIMYPNQGFSVLGSFGGAFWDPETDALLLKELHSQIDPSRIEVWDGAINEAGFGKKCAQWLLKKLETKAKKSLSLSSDEIK